MLTVMESGTAAAQATNPVYDPTSKSYYAIIDVHARQMKFHTGYVWREALEDAPRNVYHGVHGRLAIISSRETHEFLMRAFYGFDDYLWIGFRYGCEAKRLIDSTGRIVPKAAFSVWDSPWNQDPVAVCIVNPYTHKLDPGSYGAVAYSPFSKGFRWVVKGPAKGYNAYLIEYPTGRP
jgi:hypothetical protein